MSFCRSCLLSMKLSKAQEKDAALLSKRLKGFFFLVFFPLLLFKATMQIWGWGVGGGGLKAVKFSCTQVEKPSFSSCAILK